MKETTLQEKLKQRRLELGLTMKEVAKSVGVSEGTISRWESGDIENMKRDKILLYANALKVSPAVVMGWEEDTTSHSSKGIRIPVLGKVAAGIPINAIENIIDYEEIPEETAKHGEYFGLKIKGDSMSPRIAEGDTVIVRKQEDADSGDVVIVLINGEEATCKRLMKYRDKISLISFNPLYKPMEFTNKEIMEKPVQIIGRVVENRQKY